MNPIKYLKKNGIHRTLKVIYSYKIDIVIRKVILFLSKNSKLKNIIIIESHNDFDNNGGAFYQYLIKNGYNKRFEIVWLIKNNKPKELPPNVTCYPLYKPSVKKDYAICKAKFFTADCVVTGKVREGQKSYYLTHGAFALKNSKGKIDIPNCVDYILIPSEFTRKMQEIQFNPQPQTNMISIGFPIHDQLLKSCTPQLYKMGLDTSQKKTIVWMPTFRKGGGYQRNDSRIELPLGIPLVENTKQLDELNQILKKNSGILIIKIHPMQDMSTVHIKEQSNIRLLTGNKSKELGIDNYELLKETDAMISDYSSVAYDYLFLDKPLGYIFSDLNEYKSGLAVKNPSEWMAGPTINNFEELRRFIEEILSGIDNYESRRVWLRKKIFEFDDGNACRRLADHMGLDSESAF